MTQLVYHPAFDPYNALLRTVRILLALPEGVDRLTIRLLDFFLLFPESLASARLTPQLRSKLRKLEVDPRYPYDRLPGAKVLFERMGPAFEAAIQTLLARGVASHAEKGNIISLVVEKAPNELLDLAREQNENESERGLMELLAEMAREFPSRGAGGLKDRSGLMEYRYDVL